VAPPLVAILRVMLSITNPIAAGNNVTNRSIVIGEATNFAGKYDSAGMRKYIYLLAILGLFAACEQKTTTVNPPADKKESNTTVVNPPSEKKETNTTVINPPGQSTTKEEKTDVNVNTSPNP